MHPIRLVAAAASLAASSLLTSAHAASPAELEVLEVRAKQFAQAVSTGRPEEMERLVREHFGTSMQQIPMPAHLGIQMSYWDMTRGFDVVRLDQADLPPYQTYVVIRNHLTQRENLIVLSVEGEPPHQINGVQAMQFLTESHAIQLKRPRAPTRMRSNAQIARDLDAYMKRLEQADVFSGVVLLAKDGEVVFQHAYGQADKEQGIANRMDTRFHMASMHKMVTAVAIAQLVEKGKLSYEDPLSKFFPWVREASPFTRIRIKHLVSNTSGFPFNLSKDNPVTAGKTPESADDILRAANEEKLLFEPGARFQYSNLSFVVLGPVVQKVTGMSYEDYVRENIYKPAGMENGDPPKESGGAAFALSYQKRFDEHGTPLFHRSEYFGTPSAGPGNASGGGYAAAGDLLRFERALRSGKLIGAAARELLWSPKPEMGSNDYGYGFDVHTAPASVGHGGGALGVSNYMEMFRSGWTSIVLSNYNEVTFEVNEPVVLKIRELLDVQAPRKQ